MTRFATMDFSAGEARLIIQGEMVSATPWWAENGEAAAPDWFRAELGKVDGRPLTVVVDSPGGDVSCGIAIYEALRQRKGRTRCEIVRAYSAATLAVAGCDRGERYVSPAATLLYHNPATRADGDWREMEKAARFLKAVKDAAIAAYQENTGMTAEELSRLMDAETIYTAEEAIRAGFADALLPAGPGEKQAATLHEARRAVMCAEANAAACRQRLSAAEAAERIVQVANSAAIMADNISTAAPSCWAQLNALTGCTSTAQHLAAAGASPDEAKERVEAARWAQAILGKEG